MSARTLPDGWTGNDASHRRTVGAFVVHVFRLSTRRYTFAVHVGGATVARADGLGHPDAATARTAALTRLRAIAAEVVSAIDSEPSEATS